MKKIPGPHTNKNNNKVVRLIIVRIYCAFYYGNE